MPSSSNRIRGLDGLRGLAALAVVAFHYFYHGPGLYPEIGRQYGWASIGDEGVRLFFLISGFVIAMSLTGSTLRRFAIKRFIRLYPIYWICAAVTFTAVTIWGLPGREVDLKAGLLNVTMLQNLAGALNIDGVYWTLTIELLFYIQAALLWHFRWLEGRRLPVALFAWLAASQVAVYVIPFLPLGPAQWRWEQAAVNMPVFMLGICVLQFHRGERGRWLYLFGAAAIGLTALHDWDIALSAAVCLGIMLAALRWPITSWGPLLVLGEASYVLYLLHDNLGLIFLRSAAGWGLGQVPAAVLAAVAAVALAVAVTYVVERPLRRALTGLLPRRSGQQLAGDDGQAEVGGAGGIPHVPAGDDLAAIRADRGAGEDPEVVVQA
jgi:peptidoglycan/LPS O-acetylase OafA/YrhL